MAKVYIKKGPKKKQETERFTLAIPIDLARKMRKRSIAENKAVTKVIVEILNGRTI
jgi:hypothetical protein